MKTYLKNKFLKAYKEEPDFYLSCGGRFEVLGNHTDHNHGLCIAATCSLSIYAAVKKRDDFTFRYQSEGYGGHSINIAKLSKKKIEIGNPNALIRGIAAYLAKEHHYGGLDIYLKSEIPNGAGVSSSAAFELIIAQAFNLTYNDGKIPLMTLCKAGQFAEREYYGKMCGLLDQIGVAYGGLVSIDFKDIDNPVVESLKVNTDDYAFVIVNTGGSHSALSHLYKAIPDDMYKVANFFGKEYLRDVKENDFIKQKDAVINACGLSAYQRAEHFFNENKRVEIADTSIKKGDLSKLIKLMNESRESSTNLLKNMYVDEIKGSPLEACELIMEASNGQAGVKINGGGFAGSVIALVPRSVLNDVLTKTIVRYGKNNVHLVSIRNETPEKI